jgi:hypothetical protein
MTIWFTSSCPPFCFCLIRSWLLPLLLGFIFWLDQSKIVLVTRSSEQEWFHLLPSTPRSLGFSSGLWLG